MTQPPGPPPPPPPPPYGGSPSNPPPGYAPPPAYPPPPGAAYVPPPPAAYGPPPAYVPPAGYAAPGGAQPARGRVSPTRLITVFVVVLIIGLALGAAVVLALQPAAKQADCPDPSVPCGAPPVKPTLPPVARGSSAPGVTPAPTIVRPSGSLVVSSGAPTTRPSGVIASPPGSGSPSPSPSAQPTAGVTLPPVANLPQPQAPTNAEPLRTGTLWTSSSIGFRFEYDNTTWEVQDEGSNGIALVAGQGSVVIVVEGFKGSGSSTKSLVSQKVRSLGDSLLGLAEETDPARVPPGQPTVGHRQGEGTVLNGTINTPQGPGSNVSVVVLAAADGDVSIRVTVVVDEDLRDAGFSIADSVLNSIEWPSEIQ